MAGEEAERQGPEEDWVVWLIGRDQPLIKHKGFFGPPKLQGALEREADERFRWCRLWRK